MKPIARIDEIDALRGFALMGLFIVHMVEYFELYWYNPQPGWVHSAVFGVFGGKAYGIFALLFGFSFFIIMERNRQRGVDFRRGFAWRMVLLWLFGYAHSLIYAGDVLQILSSAGLLALAVRQLSSRAILVISLIFLAQVPAFAYLAFSALGGQGGPAFGPMMARNFEVFAHGSFGELMMYNALLGQQGKWAFFFESGRLWNVIGLALLGYLLARAEVVSWVAEQTRKALTVAAGLAVAAAMLFLLNGTLEPTFEAGRANWVAGQIITTGFNLFVTLLMALAFVLLYRAPVRPFLRWLAPCGRMSLTIYILQAVIFVPLFYGFGLGWYESLGQVRSLIYALVAWPVFMVAAAVWLRYFQYGPLEWLWRAATYRTRAVPLRRREKKADLGGAAAI